MLFNVEVLEFKNVIKNAFARREEFQRASNKEKLFPSVLFGWLVFVLILTVILLPFDGALSRVAGAIDVWPVLVLRKITDLALSTPYIALFTVIIIVSLFLRLRIRWAARSGVQITSTTHSYSFWGRVAGQSLFAILAILSAGAIVNIFKFIVGRARPMLIDSLGPYGFEPFNYSHAYVSFPSGHACTAAALATLVALWFPRYRIFSYLVFGLIAVSRIVVQAHYPTDVLMGFSIGGLTVLILARFFAQGNLLFHLKTGYLFPEIIIK